MTDPAAAETLEPPGEEALPETATDSESARDSTDDPTGDPTGDSDEIAALREQIEVLRRESADAKDLARRAQADLANVRRRAQVERGEFRSRAVADVCRSLLPVLDDLELAVAGARQALNTVGNTAGNAAADKAADRAGTVAPKDPAGSGAVEALREGVRLVQRRFVETLARQGLVEIEAEGAPFDPRLHDAMQRVAAQPGQADGEVVAVFRRGFVLDDRVIRPAAVVVAARAAEDTEAEGESEDTESGDGADPDRGEANADLDPAPERESGNGADRDRDTANDDRSGDDGSGEDRSAETGEPESKARRFAAWWKPGSRPGSKPGVRPGSVQNPERRSGGAGPNGRAPDETGAGAESAAESVT